MRKRTIINSVATALLAGLTASPTHAAPEPGSGAEIVVEAPRTVAPPQPSEAPWQRSAFTGAPVVTTTVKMPARYGDLDLTQPEHAVRLMTRIARTAQDACACLDRLIPLPTDRACVERAITTAIPAAKAAIAAAQK